MLNIIGQLSDECLVNVDLMRIALAYLVRPRANQARVPIPAAASDSVSAHKSLIDAKSSHSSCDGISASDFQSDRFDVLQMVSHTDELTAVERSNFDAAAARLLSLVPDDLRVSERELVDFMCRINANAHSLTLDADLNTQFGFGLFPLCALFNHSCYPNTIFTNDGESDNFHERYVTAL